MTVSLQTRLFLGLLALGLVSSAQGSDDHDHHEKKEQHDGEESHGHDESSGNFGPDKAVLKADSHAGFELREGVEVRLGIRAEKLTSGSPWSLPRSGLVKSRDEYQVFRLREGRWKAIDVQAVRSGAGYSVRSAELKAGDGVAIEGAPFLKLIELSAFGPAEGHGHGH